MAKNIIPLDELPVIDADRDIQSNFEVLKSGAAILMDKPLNWTSFDVVKYVRIRISTKKVGHAGTLDPMATGLLVLCTGKATRSISQIQALEKTYLAKIKFGESTPSYDTETDPDVKAGWQHIRKETVKEVIDRDFIGTILQKPPAYSAIKVRGERLYKKARSGKEVKLPTRQIEIYSIKIEEFNLPEITIKVRCGKGTYIRSLAHDLGLALKSRAHLKWLRRTSIGSFSVDNALTPEAFDKQVKLVKNG